MSLTETPPTPPLQWQVLEAQMLDSLPANLMARTEDTAPAIALVGRSNVGKSSLINALCARKKLAYTSGTPGKTRLVHRYEIRLRETQSQSEDRRILIDLPGYGYAKVSKAMLADWGKGLDVFLKKRDTLQAILLLIDSRHGQKEIDLNTWHWLQTLGKPVMLVGTKGDQIKQKDQAALQAAWAAQGRVMLTSSLDKQGLQALWQKLLFND
ncbi:MAG: ribosome biogenesis GTP-binding protein YihA/YsxC [Vampirovibrionales bacterium]|nr:ribosome biogenesis GTP-binding protein YihA/YsxC [Vampirovibrionales bacterium]